MGVASIETVFGDGENVEGLRTRGEALPRLRRRCKHLNPKRLLFTLSGGTEGRYATWLTLAENEGRRSRITEAVMVMGHPALKSYVCKLCVEYKYRQGTTSLLAFMHASSLAAFVDASRGKLIALGPWGYPTHCGYVRKNSENRRAMQCRIREN